MKEKHILNNSVVIDVELRNYHFKSIALLHSQCLQWIQSEVFKAEININQNQKSQLVLNNLSYLFLLNCSDTKEEFMSPCVRKVQRPYMHVISLLFKVLSLIIQIII